MIRGLYYDRQGKEITLEEMCAIKNRRVASTTLPDGKLVSTVWLGLDHSFGDGPPLIFETMVFPRGSLSDLECVRYATEEEAIKGHQAVVDRWTGLKGEIS